MHGSDEIGFYSVDECSLRPVLLLGSCPALSTPRLLSLCQPQVPPYFVPGPSLQHMA